MIKEVKNGFNPMEMFLFFVGMCCAILGIGYSTHILTLCGLFGLIMSVGSLYVRNNSK